MAEVDYIMEALLGSVGASSIPDTTNQAWANGKFAFILSFDALD